ncbi:MAG TPA: glycosyltransferase family 39 protein, partial [Chloroflexota bacterium]|nr:glycosyltransferase family 39 protein [Chloroflexota bacterium]
MRVSKASPATGWLPVAGIIALAAFLRLFYLQYGQYGSDDERLWAQALRSIAALQLPTSGIRSSIGANNGPFQVYLMMPAAAVFGSAPIAGAIVVALLNTAAVYFLYRLVDEFFGRRPALIAALLFAVNSWAIVYARRMQAQDMLIPFQVLFFWSAARWLARGRGRDLALMFVWLAVLTQVYVLGLLHLASTAVVLALGWRRLARSGLALLAGLAIWAGLSAPYFVSALLPALGSFGNVGGSHPRIDASSVLLALTMASHKGFQTIAGQAGAVLDSTSGVEGVLVLVEEALFAAGLVYAAVRLAQNVILPPRRQTERSFGLWPQNDRALCPLVLGLLLAWALIPVALFARHSVDLYPYYFVAIVPLPALFTALLLDWMWSRGGAVALGLLIANALALAGIFFTVVPGYWTKNDYGLPYRYTFDIAPQVQRLAAEHHLGRVYVDGDMDPSEVMSSVLSRDGLDVFWFDDYRAPEFAAPPAGDQPALYLIMADTTDTARFLRERFANRQTLAFPLAGEGVTIRGYELTPGEVRQALEPVLPEKLELRAANGIVLQSFGAERRLQPGGTLRAALGWTWPGGARPGKLRYAIFAHLVDGSGKVLAEVDNPLLPSVD